MMFLIIISHGLEGDILLSGDSKQCFTVNQLASRFEKMEHMKGKSKILIVEACRGDKYNTGITVELPVNKNGSNNSSIPSNKLDDTVLIKVVYFLLIY